MTTRRLLPCPACARHVAATETACPFCAGALAFAEPAPLLQVPGRRLKRAALFALGAGAAAVVGCGSSMAIYGGPGTPYEAGVPDDEAGSFVPPYGAAPPDDAAAPDAADAGADGDAADADAADAD